jgi:dynein heavy chain
VNIAFDIRSFEDKVGKKVESFKDMWEDEKRDKLWEHKAKLSIDKLVDKNPSNTWMEIKMNYYNMMINEFESMPKERTAFFIQVNFSPVITLFRNEARSWMTKHGDVMRTLGIKDLDNIRKEIDEYRDKLSKVPDEIEDLKRMLNLISEIYNKSMIMEFRISDVTEKFRTLEMYNQVIDSD